MNLRELSLGCVLEALKHIEELEVCISINSGEILKMLVFNRHSSMMHTVRTSLRRAGKMAQQIKVLATKPHSLNCSLMQ